MAKKPSKKTAARCPNKLAARFELGILQKIADAAHIKRALTARNAWRDDILCKDAAKYLAKASVHRVYYAFSRHLRKYVEFVVLADDTITTEDIKLCYPDFKMIPFGTFDIPAHKRRGGRYVRRLNVPRKCASPQADSIAKMIDKLF